MNLNENMHWGQTAQAASNQLRWDPFAIARPLMGGTHYGFEHIDNIHVATADDNCLVIGLVLRGSNNTVYKPSLAAGRSELMHVECEVVRSQTRATTRPNLFVTLGRDMGIIRVPLQHIGGFEIKVLGRTILANVPASGDTITEDRLPPLEESTN